MGQFYDITLTIHGPFKTVAQLKNELSEARKDYGEKRAVYMATKRGSNGEDKFIYIGITAQEKLENRFNDKNHTIRNFPNKWDNLWVGYFATEKIDRTQIGRHEGRLKFAETLLINYFHPELNADELYELHYDDGSKETIGGGSNYEGIMTFKWRNENNKAKATPSIKKIPEKVHYRFNNKLGAEYDHVFAYT